MDECSALERDLRIAGAAFDRICSTPTFPSGIISDGAHMEPLSYVAVNSMLQSFAKLAQRVETLEESFRRLSSDFNTFRLAAGAESRESPPVKFAEEFSRQQILLADTIQVLNHHLYSHSAISAPTDHHHRAPHEFRKVSRDHANAEGHTGHDSSSLGGDTRFETLIPVHESSTETGTPVESAKILEGNTSSDGSRSEVYRELITRLRGSRYV